MIDWHCHLLPGIDDGPATMDEAVEMAAALAQRGFTSVCCTPHLLKGCYEADNATVRGVLAALQTEVNRRGIPLRLLAGREYYQDEFLAEQLHSPLLLGETRFLLIEIPGHSLPDLVKEACYRITGRGFIPMIAHPERCRLFDFSEPRVGELRKMFDVRRSMLDAIKNTLHRHSGLPGRRSQTSNIEPRTPSSKPRTSNSLLEYLIDLGCAFQGNLGSFAGGYGERVKQRAEKLREAGIYTHFGTDAHTVDQIRGLELTAIR